MTAILEVDGLYGGYFPNKPVLKNITFSVAPGQMIGMIGLNGAGKSTTIKHILGLMQPQQGTIRIRGMTLEDAPELYRSSFAYVPETPELYEELTIQEHLELTARVYGLDRNSYLHRSEKLLYTFNMKDKSGSFSAHLSKGMKQKTMIMNALLVQPPLYIIDEPFVGLDPLGIRSLLDLMVSLKQEGASFLISSHILSTIENYCDGFIVLHNGEIVAQGDLDALVTAAKLDEGTLEDAFCTLVDDGGAL